jgi:hypothetical protein
MLTEEFDNIEKHRPDLAPIFDWMPVCSLIVDSHGIIMDVNQKAIQFFRATTKEDFIFDKQNLANMIVDSQRANELFRQIYKSSESINKEILIRRFDKTISGIDLHACPFPGNADYILIQFYEKNTTNQIHIRELSQAFSREAQRLKPYLNKPGKNILEEIVTSDFSEGQNTKNKPVVIISKERMEQLTALFPEFSSNELSLCGYLSLKMSIDEIASLMGKTPNCLRVSFHRILKKTSFSTGKEFQRKLESI